MDRLTIRNSDGSVSQPTTTTFEKAMYRLAAYEDTNLMPDEVAGAIVLNDILTDCGVPLAHLRELLEAERAGRLAVLPCKVGDLVCVLLDDGAPHIARVQGISMSASCKDTILHFGGWPAVTVWGSDLGKTWFLSEKDAEAALQGGGTDAK